VLGTVVGRDRLAAAEADGDQALAVNAVRDQPAANAEGASFR
jgi:hypothetical protein